MQSRKAAMDIDLDDTYKCWMTLGDVESIIEHRVLIKHNFVSLDAYILNI